MLDPSFVPDATGVDETGRRLFARLNPAYLPGDTGTLAVYDWEIAQDTGAELETVRTALRILNGMSLEVEAFRGEYRVIGLAAL